MRRILSFVLAVLLSTSLVSAQKNSMEKTGNDRFSIKAQPFMGFYIDQSSNLMNINPNAPTGVNLGFEFPSSQQLPWQQYLNNPTVGLGLSYINWGADVMGHAIAAYPYILLNAVRLKHFEMKFKLAAGLGVVSRHYYSHEIYEKDFNDARNNTTFSTYLNAYLSAGLNLDFPITRNFAINTEFGFFHMSNGKTRIPNRGANIFYGAVGVISTINPEGEEKEAIEFPDLPYRWSLNVTGAAGAMHLHRDDKHRFLVASFHTGAIYNVCNWYGVGAGVDVFFNDCVNTNTNQNNFYRFDLGEYTFTDKLRVGIGLNNEFTFGDFTALLDWGVYVFNPSRKYYKNFEGGYDANGVGLPKEELKRPLFYKVKDVGVDDGWNYIRLGAKYRIWDNIYLQASAKLHLQICECVEFGIGYRIPFLKKEHRNNGKGTIFRQHKKWWEKY